jgi:hypothetical protein
MRRENPESGDASRRWCPMCGTELPEAAPVGRERRWCSALCRQRVMRSGGAETVARLAERDAALLETLGRGDLAAAQARRLRWRVAALRGEPVPGPPPAVPTLAELAGRIRELTGASNGEAWR